jgi:hypothetical protein
LSKTTYFCIDFSTIEHLTIIYEKDAFKTL